MTFWDAWRPDQSGGAAVTVAALRSWADGGSTADELLEPGRACRGGQTARNATATVLGVVGRRPGTERRSGLGRAAPGRPERDGVPARWVAGDEVYGADSKLRKHLREAGLGYVLAVAKNHQIVTGIGAPRAIDLAVRLPARSWQRLSAGRGSRGERWSDDSGTGVLLTPVAVGLQADRPGRHTPGSSCAWSTGAGTTSAVPVRARPAARPERPARRRRATASLRRA